MGGEEWQMILHIEQGDLLMRATMGVCAYQYCYQQDRFKDVFVFSHEEVKESHNRDRDQMIFAFRDFHVSRWCVCGGGGGWGMGVGGHKFKLVLNALKTSFQVVELNHPIRALSSLSCLV